MSSNEAGVTELTRGNRKTREGLVVSDKTVSYTHLTLPTTILV